MTTTTEREANKVGLRMNADKCKVMVTTQAWNDDTSTEVDESTTEMVRDFCYLAATYHKIVTVIESAKRRLEKQIASLTVSKKLEKISTLANLPIKVNLYESLVMATMLYSAELWILRVKHMKTLEAAHHNFSDDCWE